MSFGDLRGILQYVPQFRGKTFVVALDGAVVASDNFSNILLDIAVLNSLSIRVALVHGAAEQIRALADKRGITPSNDDGSGATDAETLEVAVDAITRLNHAILQNLGSVDLRAATANALSARPAGIVHGRDQGSTGRVTKVDDGSLRTMLDQGMIPVIPPLAAGGSGGNLRLHSDAVAKEVAVSLRADKLIFLAARDVPFLSEERRHYAIGVHEAAGLLEHLEEPWASRLRFAREACSAGVARTHMLHGLQNEALLAELFSNEGVGLMVFADAYVSIRPIESWDIPEIISMIHDSVEQDALVQRRQEEIEENQEDFRVIEVDGNVVGTAALHYFPAQQAAEVACLFIKRTHENQGYARKLLRNLEQEARKRGAQRIFALTTQARGFFDGKCGFQQADPASLPPERRARLEESGRNSFVLEKSLR